MGDGFLCPQMHNRRLSIMKCPARHGHAENRSHMSRNPARNVMGKETLVIEPCGNGFLCPQMQTCALRILRWPA
jgi:hypothetical protein